MDILLSNVVVASAWEPWEYRRHTKSQFPAFLVKFCIREKTALEKFLSCFESMFNMEKILVMFKEQADS